MQSHINPPLAKKYFDVDCFLLVSLLEQLKERIVKGALNENYSKGLRLRAKRNGQIENHE